MKSILPDWLFELIKNSYKLDEIQELRLRVNKPIQVCYRGKMLELKNNAGLYLRAVTCSQEFIDYVVSLATKNSIYAFDEQIKNGYIVTENGIRIGLCGTAVNSNDKITFIKNITSLNIRIAHQVIDCCQEIIPYLIKQNAVKNTLIISPPGAGKTTLLRDLILKLSDNFQISNIMVVDEKLELAGENDCYNLGKNVDVMQSAGKKFCFYDGIKVMNPSLIATDELISEDDIAGVEFAIYSGVKVIATAHAGSIEELKNKVHFDKLFKEKLFERFVVLSKRNGVGSIEGVFDENGFALYLPYLK